MAINFTLELPPAPGRSTTWTKRPAPTPRAPVPMPAPLQWASRPGSWTERYWGQPPRLVWIVGGYNPPWVVAGAATRCGLCLHRRLGKPWRPRWTPHTRCPEPGRTGRSRLAASPTVDHDRHPQGVDLLAREELGRSTPSGAPSWANRCSSKPSFLDEGSFDRPAINRSLEYTCRSSIGKRVGPISRLTSNAGQVRSTRPWRRHGGRLASSPVSPIIGRMNMATLISRLSQSEQAVRFAPARSP